jgi:UDP-2,3-diacylglucosamine pyrophosphatase LpxH
MPSKFKIVVSDLHLSAGREAEGNPLEDFGSDQEFMAFLGEMAAESERDGAEVELIINGDAFEMLQVPHSDIFDPQKVYPPEDYYSSSEADSVRKMAIIIAGHRPFFDSLRQFIQVGPPRRYVTFVKGNHDLNLHWPAVQGQIRQAMNASGEREPLLSFEERCVAREGIYVEHGNQYAEVLDRIKDMEQPHDHDRPGQLDIPPGSWFVMDIFNEVERQKYWIDGIKPITALVFYALRYDFAFAARAIATMARRLPGIFRHIVLEGAEPGEPDPLADLILKSGDPAQVEQMAERYETDVAYRSQIDRALTQALAPQAELMGADVSPAGTAPNPLDVGDQIRNRVNSSLFNIAAQRAEEEGVELVTFGHTHDASLEHLPNGGVYINSGTWTWRADFSSSGSKTWKDLFAHPEKYTEERLLSYVRIDYRDGEPVGSLENYQPSPAPEPRPEGLPETGPSCLDRMLAWFRGLFGGDSGSA